MEELQIRVFQGELTEPEERMIDDLQARSRAIVERIFPKITRTSKAPLVRKPRRTRRSRDPQSETQMFYMTEIRRKLGIA